MFVQRPAAPARSFAPGSKETSRHLEAVEPSHDVLLFSGGGGGAPMEQVEESAGSNTGKNSPYTELYKESAEIYKFVLQHTHTAQTISKQASLI